MTAATRDLATHQLPSGTTNLGLAQQLATSLGIAIVTLTLVTSLNTVPVSQGAGLDRLLGLSAPDRAGWLADLGSAVAVTYGVVVVLMLAAHTSTVLRLRDRRPVPTIGLR